MSASHNLRSERGQSLVEFALIFPVVMLVLMGIMEFGRAFNIKHGVTDATREGARLAVVQDPIITMDSVRKSIQRRLSSFGVDTVDVSISFDTLNPPSGHWRESGAIQTMTVGAKHRFVYFAPLFRAILGADTIRLKSTLSMRNE